MIDVSTRRRRHLQVIRSSSRRKISPRTMHFTGGLHLLLLAQTVPQAAAYPADAKAGAGATTKGTTFIGSNPSTLELAKVRKELFEAECGKDSFKNSLPCKTFTFSQLLSKTQDPTERSKLIKDHIAGVRGRTKEQKKSEADEGWRATKSMYTDFCASPPSDSQVCTNAVLKKTYYERDSRPVPGAKGSPSLIDKLGALIKSIG